MFYLLHCLPHPMHLPLYPPNFIFSPHSPTYNSPKQKPKQKTSQRTTTKNHQIKLNQTKSLKKNA